MFLVKYDTNGNVIWAEQSNSVSAPSYSQGTNVTIDKVGNIYVTGLFYHNAYFDSISLNTYRNSFFIAKYDSSGNVIWAKQSTMANELYGEVPFPVIADKYNNVYVTGTFSSYLVIGSTTLYGPNSYSTYAFIAKYDSSGNVLWAKQSDILPSDTFASISPHSIAADNDDHIYITGRFSDTVSLEKVKLISSPGHLYNVFLVKSDLAGNALWGKSSTCPLGNSWAGFTVVTDTQNHVYVSGGSGGGSVINDTIQFGSNILAVTRSKTDGNSVLVKFDTSGNVLCGTIITGGGDDINGLAVDPSGKYIYLGGDMFNAIRLGSDSLPLYKGEVPFMARWQTCCENKPGLVTTLRDTICPGQTGNLLLANTSGNNILWQSSFTDTNFTNIAGAKDTTMYKTNPLNQSTYYRAIVESGTCVHPYPNALELIIAPAVNCRVYGKQYWQNGNL